MHEESANPTITHHVAGQGGRYVAVLEGEAAEGYLEWESGGEKDGKEINVAVLEKAYLGSGNTARNTAVIRSNYLTSEGVRFYAESVKMFQSLSNEFDFNIMYSERGQLTLAHTDATVRAFRQRAEVNKHFGGRTEMIDRQQIRELVPSLNLDPGHLRRHRQLNRW